jgi:hypothetical protein
MQIFLALAQRGNKQHEAVKAMIEIFAKFADGNALSQRAVCCGDNADVRPVQALTPDALELAVLNRSQNFRLGKSWKTRPISSMWF